MGLAGPKKRAKLSHDPNNTAWSRNTESFGHKILASQGWTPGDTLGAKGAAHADHYTAGSNSHIRVMLKDNQLGLGAKLGGNSAETFGLSLFSGILGRLNGKTDVQVEREQRAQKDVELALYQSRKLGNITFISAGFLVGDRIERAEIVTKEDMEKTRSAASAPNAGVDGQSEIASHGTKRKRTGAKTESRDSTSESSASSEDDDETGPPAHKPKKTKKQSKTEPSEVEREQGEEAEAAKTKKRTNKSKKDDKKKHKSSSTSNTGSENDQRAAAKKLRKAERRAEKEERRKKKEARRAAKSASASASAPAPASASASASTTPATSTSTTPAAPASGASTPQPAPFVGRHAVRQRYIAAKGRAHLDPQALKEVSWCTVLSLDPPFFLQIDPGKGAD